MLSQYFPTCRSWLGVGVACYEQGELRNAEDALAEANVLDNLDWRPWAYLALICLRQERFREAEETFVLAVRCGIPDNDAVMVELRRELDARGLDTPKVLANDEHSEQVR